MKKELDTLKNCLEPRPNLLVSCRSKKGEDNALAVAYGGNCSYRSYRQKTRRACPLDECRYFLCN